MFTKKNLWNVWQAFVFWIHIDFMALASSMRYKMIITAVQNIFLYRAKTKKKFHIDQTIASVGVKPIL